MKTRKLVTVKPHRYGTRHLVAGDEYEAPERDAIALVASRKVRFVTTKAMPTVPPAQAAPPPEPKPVGEVSATTPDTGLELLRERAERLGIEVDRRWGIARLQQAIREKRAAD